LNEYFKKMLCEFLDGETDSNIDFSQYPQHLFKYRSCNKYGFEMLEEGYLWVDQPQNFDDPFDALVSIDKDDALTEYKNHFNLHAFDFADFILSMFYPQESKERKLLEEMFGFIKTALDSTKLYDKNAVKNKMIGFKESLTEEQKLSLYDFGEKNKENIAKLNEIYDVKDSVDAFNKFINLTANSVRDYHMVCCLSKRKDNRKMWEEYADKYKGFVVEYSLDKNNEQSSKIRNLFEIEYYDEIPSFDLGFLFESFYNLFICNGETKISSITFPLAQRLLIKKSDYKSEEEWRYITEKTENKKVSFPFVSAVYAGYLISEKNINKLKEICKKKNIPLYKQELDSIGGRIVFYPVDLCED